MIEAYSVGDIISTNDFVPFSEVKKVLKRTEPVTQVPIYLDGKDNIQIVLDDDWGYGGKQRYVEAPTNNTISINDKTWTLNRSCTVALYMKIGLSERFAYRTPGSVVEPLMNYYFNDGHDLLYQEELSLIVKDGMAVGITDANMPIVSNVLVVEEIEKFLNEKMGSSKVFVDSRISNTYGVTDFRLIMAEPSFSVTTKRNGVEEEDFWHYGIRVTNSLVTNSARPLNIAGFMLENKTQAGIVPEYSNLIGFSRRMALDTDDLRGWVRSTLSQVFAVLPAEAQLMQEMPKYSFHGQMGTTLTDVFATLKIPRKVQTWALDRIVENGDMTSYGIMHAIAGATSAKYGVKMSPTASHYIQSTMGALPARAKEFCDSCGRLHIQIG